MSTMQQKETQGSLAILDGIRSKQLMFRTQSQMLNAQDVAPAKSQVICVASGKGGTGKTLVASNLAVMLAKLGARVTLIDADMGLANAHLLLGITPRYDISHVLSGEQPIQNIIERGPWGMRLVPGGSGYPELSTLSDEKLADLADAFMKLEDSSDIIIVDLGAGISPQIIRFLNVAHDIVLVSNHEITTQSDTMATIKTLADTLGAASIHLVINRARNREHAVVAFQQIWNKVNRQWRGRIKLFFSGWLPHNWYVQSAIIMGKPVVDRHPQSLPTRCFRLMGAKMLKHHKVWRGRQVGRWGMPSAFARLKQMATG